MARFPAIHVFNPHDRAFPDFLWNHSLLYYPGDEWVDWIGLTGYNNGVAHPGDRWRGFVEIHDPLYAEYLTWWPSMPFMITEFSSNENGGDKAAWIGECAATLQVRYPRIKVAVWFDQIDGLWEYQLSSSDASMAAFREALSRPEFQVQPQRQP
jgi:mannan endo-1,4-beta-mannosidase